MVRIKVRTKEGEIKNLELGRIGLNGTVALGWAIVPLKELPAWFRRLYPDYELLEVKYEEKTIWERGS